MKNYFYLVLFLLFFSFGIELNAQISWEETGGPFGGSVREILEEPDGNILAITYGSVYRSTDKGLNWNKLTFDGFSPAKINYDDNTAYIIPTPTDWYNNVIYRSDDKLLTCQLKNSGLENKGINGLYIANGKIYACTSDGIYASTDKGENWTKAYTVSDDGWVSNLVINSKGDLFAGTLGGLYRSTDNGSNWTLLNDEAQELETNIEHLLVNSKDTIFVTTPYGPYRSADNGDTWVHLINEFPQSNVGFILLLNDEELLIANSWMGIFHSTNSGDVWTKIYDKGGNDAIIQENGNVFIATLRGVLFADDLTGTWEYRKNGMKELSVSTILINRNDGINKNTIFVGDDNGAIHKSTDNGLSWSFLTQTDGADVSSLVMDNDENIYAGTIWGGAYRSNNGETWEPINNGLDDPDVRTLALDHDGNLYAGTFSAISKSTDKGDTWTTCFSQEQSVQCSTIVVNSRNMLFAGTIAFGALRSTNNGQTWTQIYNGMKLAVDHIFINNQDELFAVTAGSDLYKSTNDGNNWSLVKANMGISNIFLLSDKDILASVDRNHEDIGVYLSNDKGQTWNLVEDGLNENYVYSFDKNTDGYVYAATSSGVFRSTVTVVSVEEDIASESMISISPNPAVDFADINLVLTQNNFISISLFDLIGNKKMDVAEEFCESGNQNFKLNIDNLSQGLYYVNIQIGNQNIIKPIVVIR